MHQAGGVAGRSTAERPPIMRHLNQIELARRWGISPRTLERWRWQKTGPRYIKLGSHVAYRVDDIEAFEAEQER
jgi:predicted DNA-binding transcriptional regulator AlpA